MFRIMRSYTLQAAHHLPRVPEGHKCGRLHGHTYEVEVWFEGTLRDDRGWFMDFAEIDTWWNTAVHAVLDHQNLNDHIDNPTTENLCVWIANALTKVHQPSPLQSGVQMSRLCKVVARENNHSAVEYEV